MNPMPKPMWVAMLAKMVAPMDSERASQAITAMLPMLSLPPEAFTIESVKEVCQSGRISGLGEHGPLTRVPTFIELEKALGRWWARKVELELVRAAPTPRARLAAPPQENGPTQDAIDYVADRLRTFHARRSLPSAADGPRVKVKPLHLSDERLALEYERLGIRNPRAPV